MNALAPNHISTSQGYRVLGLADGGLIIEQRAMPVFARIAVSCLVQPEPGDIVLATASGALWVIAVLERECTTPLRLRAPTGLSIDTETAPFTLSAASLRVQSSSAVFALQEVLHTGRRLTAHVTDLKFIGNVIETLVGRALLHARNSLRNITESDQVRAGNIEHTAEGALHLQAENAFVTAAAIRMDAGQIHMG